MSKLDTAQITVRGVYHVKAKVCYKCGCRVFPASEMKAHLERHDINRKLYVKDFQGRVREKRRWEFQI